MNVKQNVIKVYNHPFYSQQLRETEEQTPIVVQQLGDSIVEYFNCFDSI